MSTKPNTVFLGTPEFARVILQGLYEQNYPISCVVAQPDKPAHRGQKLQSPPVAVFAKEKGLELLQPTKIRDGAVIQKIASYKPDFLIVAAYGKILPDELLEVPKVDTINVHASLLPKYRGAAPITYALLEGERETGVSIMSVASELDAGAVYAKESLEISDQDTTASLTQRLAQLGAKALPEVLEQIRTRGLTATEQNHNQATYAPKLSKELSRIDWTASSQEIFNRVRALVPWPVAKTFLCGKGLKVYACTPLEQKTNEAPGSLVHISSQGFTVTTGTTDVLVTEVQFEGKKRMKAFDLANGLRLKAPQRFAYE